MVSKYSTLIFLNIISLLFEGDGQINYEEFYTMMCTKWLLIYVNGKYIILYQIFMSFNITFSLWVYDDCAREVLQSSVSLGAIF